MTSTKWLAIGTGDGISNAEANERSEGATRTERAGEGAGGETPLGRNKMKFLCVPCDTPMKLQTVAPPERGSLSVVYACPECGYEMAMLTNPFETQLVQSLGVRIGPEMGVGASSTGSTSASG